MTFPLFSQVQLTQDIPQFSLKREYWHNFSGGRNTQKSYCLSIQVARNKTTH